MPNVPLCLKTHGPNTEHNNINTWVNFERSCWQVPNVVVQYAEGIHILSKFCVIQGKIKSLEQIYLHSLPVKEYQIVEFFLGPALKDEVMKIMPVQKQTRAGQRTRFKAFVVVGDMNGHVGLGVKCSKEVATAIRGAICLAKITVVPVSQSKMVVCRIVPMFTNDRLPFLMIVKVGYFLVGWTYLHSAFSAKEAPPRALPVNPTGGLWRRKLSLPRFW